MQADFMRGPQRGKAVGLRFRDQGPVVKTVTGSQWMHVHRVKKSGRASVPSCRQSSKSAASYPDAEFAWELLTIASDIEAIRITMTQCSCKAVTSIGRVGNVGKWAVYPAQMSHLALFDRPDGGVSSRRESFASCLIQPHIVAEVT